MRALLGPVGLGFALGLFGACFSAPRPAVQFSCDPDDAPECPEGYTCESDGCCHLDGTDFEDHEGQCQLAGAVAPTEGSDPVLTAGSSSDDGTTDPATDSGSSQGSSGGSSTEGGATAGSSGSGFASSGTASTG